MGRPLIFIAFSECSSNDNKKTSSMGDITWVITFGFEFLIYLLDQILEYLNIGEEWTGVLTLQRM